jgi:hypothetical protein
LALDVKHAFVSGKSDGGDATQVQPSNWNAAHTLTATDGKLLGASGSTTVGEVTVGSGLSLAAGTLSASGGGGATLAPQITRYSSDAYMAAPLSTDAMAPNLSSSNTLYIVPLPIMSSGTVTRIGISVTTAAAGNARLGLYEESGNGQAGTLLLDAGTVSTGTTGDKEITISQALSPGLYWCALVLDATPSLTFYGVTDIFPLFPYSAGLARVGSMRRTFTYAALPSDESAASYTANSLACPVVYVRAP